MAAILDSKDRGIAVETVTNNTYTAMIGHIVLNALPENFKIKLFDEMKITEEDFMSSVASVILEVMPYDEFVKRADALKMRIEANEEMEDPYDGDSEPISDETANDVLYMNGLIMGAVNSQLTTFFREVEGLPDSVQGLDSLTIKNETPESLKNIINKDEVKNFSLETMKAITADIRNDIEIKEEAEKKEQELISKANENEAETSDVVDDTDVDDETPTGTDDGGNGFEFTNEPDDTDLGEDEPLDDSEVTPSDTPASSDVPTDDVAGVEPTTDIPDTGGNSTPSDDVPVIDDSASTEDVPSTDNTGVPSDETPSTEDGVNFGNTSDMGEDEPLDDDTFVLEDDSNMLPPDTASLDTDSGNIGMDSEDDVNVDDNDFDFNPVDDGEMGGVEDYTSDVPNIGDDNTSSDITDDFNEPISEDDFTEDKKASDTFQESQKAIIRRKVSYIESIQSASLSMFKAEVMKMTGKKTPVVFSENSIVNTTATHIKLLAEAVTTKQLSEMTKEELKAYLTQETSKAQIALITLKKTAIVNKTAFLQAYADNPNKAIRNYMVRNKGILTGVLQQLLDYMLVLTMFGLLSTAVLALAGPAGVMIANVIGGMLHYVMTDMPVVSIVSALLGITFGGLSFVGGNGLFMFLAAVFGAISMITKMQSYVNKINHTAKTVDVVLQKIQTMPGLSEEERKVMSEKAVDIYEGERAKGPKGLFNKVSTDGVLFGKALYRFISADYYG